MKKLIDFKLLNLNGLFFIILNLTPNLSQSLGELAPPLLILFEGLELKFQVLNAVEVLHWSLVDLVSEELLIAVQNSAGLDYLLDVFELIEGPVVFLIRRSEGSIGLLKQILPSPHKIVQVLLLEKPREIILLAKKT